MMWTLSPLKYLARDFTSVRIKVMN